MQQWLKRSYDAKSRGYDAKSRDYDAFYPRIDAIFPALVGQIQTHKFFKITVVKVRGHEK